MKTLLDVHTHTVASGHAFSTLQEMAVAASEKGLKLLGITEHAPGIPGTCSPIYFRNLHVVPRRIYGVELLLGAELNIIDYKGTIDMGEEYFPMLDIRIAGIHSLCYKPGTVEQNTEAMIGAIYLDGGFEPAKDFVLKFILNDIEHKQLFYDSKTILQEIVQEKGIQPVEYILTGESGPDHDKQFTVSVQVNGQVVGNGTGHTKKAAEQAAAYQAIQEKKF